MVPHNGIDTTGFKRYHTQPRKEGQVLVAVHTAMIATDIIATKSVSNVRKISSALVAVGNDCGALS
jgi:hypothetical protein